MANQLAFKKTLVAGDEATQVNDVSNALRNYFANAGFTVISQTIGTFDIMRAGATLADTSDDTPHWRIDSETSGEITMHVLKGSWPDEPPFNSEKLLSVADIDGTGDKLVRFYCNSATGMWWFYLTNSTGGHDRAVVGTTLRRYPADTTQGLMCRYGILQAATVVTDSFCMRLPYVKLANGTAQLYANLDTWSPLMGMSISAAPTRHASSTMPAMAAPLFVRDSANFASGITACLPGELEQVQLLTSSAAGDYTLEQVLSPGVMALPDTNPSAMHLALPYTTFTVL